MIAFAFDPAVMVRNLADNWSLALTIAGVMFTMTLFAVRVVHPSVRETITLRLMGVEQERWCDSFCSLFDGLFGRNHLSLICILRSILASLVAVTLLWVAVGGEGTFQSRTDDALPFAQVLLVGLVINVIADYVSLLETRWLLGRMRGWQSVWAQGCVLLVDLLVTAAIILGAIYAYSLTPLHDGAQMSAGKILGVFSIYSIFFYSTFITSVWTWGYILSSWMMRLFARYRLAERLDAKDNLAFVLAGFVAVMVGAVTLVASIPLQKDEFGISPIERVLCDRFGGETCLAAAALTKDEQLKADLVLQGCATGASETCIEEGFRGYEIDPEKAALYWDAACTGGNAIGCYNLRFLYQNGAGVAQDASRAATLYEQGCTGGDAGGCLNRAIVALGEGEGNDIIMMFAEKACDLDPDIHEICDQLNPSDQ